MRPIRKLRRSQTISPFGVGAVFDVLGESFVAESIDRWKGRPVVLENDRLSRLMGATAIWTAPPAPSGNRPAELMGASGLPFYRFPRWLFCSSCRRMQRLRVRDESWGEVPKCTCPAKRQLVPMRFVMVCGMGHLDDVDWFYWAHFGTNEPDRKQCQAWSQLRFETVKGVGGGLQSVRVRCESCGSSRSLDGIARPDVPRSMGIRCSGRQPWQYPNEKVECTAPPAFVQRGASNVHFPIIRTALDIPPGSDYAPQGEVAARIKADPTFQLLMQVPTHQMRSQLLKAVASNCRVSESEVEATLAMVLATDYIRPSGVSTINDRDILADEWLALRAPTKPDPHPRDNFVTRRASADTTIIPAEFQRLWKLVDDLVEVVRLREVRALTGFSRFTQDAVVPVDLGPSRLGWLPGTETFGEGIFFALDESEVRSWESTPQALGRAARLKARLDESFLGTQIPEATPRFVLLHTLSHILMRQMIYETGYSSASIRERIYASRDMAGVLLYTAAGDAEGSLGGLVRQGLPKRFLSLLANALTTATWCSLDPVCRESAGQGTDALSLAACHGCALVSETSCVASNVLLDRVGLVGGADGFFAQGLEPILQAATHG